MFAFSVSWFQREEVSSALSHTLQIHRQVKGRGSRGFNNIRSLILAILSVQRVWRGRTVFDMGRPAGKARCPYKFIDPDQQTEHKTTELFDLTVLDKE